MSLSCMTVSNTQNHYPMIRTGIETRNTIHYPNTYYAGGSMESLGDRLRGLMSEREWSEGELARRSGLKQPTIHRILTGQSKDPRQGNIEKLAFALGVSATWLRSGRGGREREGANFAPAQQSEQRYSYPVVSWVAAGSWCEAIAPHEPGSEQTYKATDYQAKGRAFWLEVKGDSMTAPTGVSIPEGMMILVDTGVPAVNGSLVIASISDGEEATFKKLVIDGGVNYLKPLNPAYPVITCSAGCEIVGTVIEARLKLRFTTH